MGQAGLQVAEALRAEQQVPDDQQGPAVPDQVEGVGGRAAVAIRASFA